MFSRSQLRSEKGAQIFEMALVAGLLTASFLTLSIGFGDSADEAAIRRAKGVVEAEQQEIAFAMGLEFISGENCEGYCQAAGTEGGIMDPEYFQTSYEFEAPPYNPYPLGWERLFLQGADVINPAIDPGGENDGPGELDN